MSLSFRVNFASNVVVCSANAWIIDRTSAFSGGTGKTRNIISWVRYHGSRDTVTQSRDDTTTWNRLPHNRFVCDGNPSVTSVMWSLLFYLCCYSEQDLNKQPNCRVISYVMTLISLHCHIVLYLNVAMRLLRMHRNILRRRYNDVLTLHRSILHTRVCFTFTL